VPYESGYIPFHPNPVDAEIQARRRARWTTTTVFGPKPSSVCAHAQVTPCDAPQEKLFARHASRFRQGVIVQATCHNHRQSRVVDALVTSKGRGQGCRVCRRELRRISQAADRDGIRAGASFIKRLVDSTPRDVDERIAAGH